MKATGITRKLDTLGRIVIPKELRNVYDLKTTDNLEIFTTDEGIFIRKYEGTCCVCNEDNSRELELYKKKLICKKCIKGIKSSL